MFCVILCCLAIVIVAVVVAVVSFVGVLSVVVVAVLLLLLLRLLLFRSLYVFVFTCCLCDCCFVFVVSCSCFSFWLFLRFCVVYYCVVLFVVFTAFIVFIVVDIASWLYFVVSCAVVTGHDRFLWIALIFIAFHWLVLRFVDLCAAFCRRHDGSWSTSRICGFKIRALVSGTNYFYYY